MLLLYSRILLENQSDVKTHGEWPYFEGQSAVQVA